MSSDNPILVLDHPRSRLDASLAGRQILQAELPLADGPITVCAAVADEPARLSQLVPLARAASDDATRTACDRSRREGRTVSCLKGCSPCCHYLVPVSGPEAFALLEDIQDLDAGTRDHLVGSFVRVAQTVLQSELPSLEAAPGETTAGLLGQWSARINQPCPLLHGAPEARRCRLYSRRPLACREHIVTTKPELCGGFQPGAGRVRPRGVSMVEALSQLAAELEDTDVEAILLPLAPAWALANLDRGQRTWPAPYLVRRLLAIAREQAQAGTAQASPIRAAA
ncbi:MAG: hypothetical protein BWX88_05238 [Planctomycetes bacterium ADurb.Bin126]|nr:MAG: hypothetical protein BWX88_05238 [Planctomycetes bacterium ADurb.Bin126]HOD83173.1 YkgJ family cysteine cluster protein [Phycisphaerae bacterium]HQL75348.1 YkgJ family cysteine cluster protein [Phycisphaerae bacterium]